MALIEGTPGDDSLTGTDQNDTIYLSPGNDTLDGGAGVDEVNSFGSTSLPDRTLVDLKLGTVTGPNINHTLRNIENFWSEQSANTTLRGDDQNNKLIVTISTGNSVIEGRGGNDELLLEGSNGSISGGDGDDKLSVFASRSQVTVEGGNGADTLEMGVPSRDYVSLSFNNLNQPILTWFNGRVSATVLDRIEIFAFEDGSNFGYADIIGKTPVMGTAGDDSLVGTEFGDTFTFSLGNDTLIGGNGSDELVARLLPASSVIDLSSNAITTPQNSQVIREIEDLSLFDLRNSTVRGDDKANIIVINTAVNSIINGGGGDDEITVNATDSQLYGDAGNDSFLLSKQGNNTLYGGADDDTFTLSSDHLSNGPMILKGGAGQDRLVLSSLERRDVSVDTTPEGHTKLSWAQSPASTQAPHQITLLDEFESFVFKYGKTFSFADMVPASPITGTETGDLLSGTMGNDPISALDGDDWITPVLGLNTIGIDTIDGGAGVDMLSYADSASASITVLMAEGRVTYSNETRASFTNIENITGTSGRDYLAGDDKANLIRGLGGNDIFLASAGGDYLKGGGGTDRIVTPSDDSGASVSLLRGRIWEGEGTHTRLSGFEHVQTGAGNDTLAGDHRNNKLDATYGDDTLMGNGGDDLIYGGFGNDVAIFAYNQDQYQITQNGNATQVAYIGPGLGDGTDQLLHIETLRFADGDLVL